MSDQVVAYERRSLPERRRLDTIPLDLPVRQFRRARSGSCRPDELMEEVGGDLLGALHAAEHALISVLPLLAMCDRWDIGGLSTNLHPQTLRPTVFVYDGHAGGVGIAQRGHDRFAELVASAARVVGECRCRDGCPSCVQSPKCGNLNEMLDKGAAARLLGAMDAARPASAGSPGPLRAARSSPAHLVPHGQGPEVQERVLRRRAQPLPLGAVGAVASRRARQRSGAGSAANALRELRARPVELVLDIRLAHVGHGAQERDVEPVHVAQQQQVAVGRADRGAARRPPPAPRSRRRSRASSSPVRAGRAPSELVEALLAHERSTATPAARAGAAPPSQLAPADRERARPGSARRLRRPPSMRAA